MKKAPSGTLIPLYVGPGYDQLQPGGLQSAAPVLALQFSVLLPLSTLVPAEMFQEKRLRRFTAGW